MANGQDAQEVLVILGPDAARAARDAVARVAPILHSVSDRVFSVRGDAGRVRRLPGVALVLTGGESEDVLRNLSETEALFAKAWLMAKQPKERKGQGLPWDAPGFLPPDQKR